MTKLENGQLEIGPAAGAQTPEPRALPALEPIEVERPSAPTDGVMGEREPSEASEEREERVRRGRRGRGRGRGRDREDRGRAAAPVETPSTDLPAPLRMAEEPVATGGEAIGASGERLTRNEAFDIVRRAVETLTTDDDDTTRASSVRQRAREILGRDSESLNERMFVRILKDAHDSGVIDLRRRGDDFEVARAAEALPVADQVARADAAAAPPRPSLGVQTPRLGMGPRGAGRGRGRLEGPPPELLSVGVVDEPAAQRQMEEIAAPVVEHAPPTPEIASTGVSEIEAPAPAEEQPQRGGRKRGRRATPASVERQAAPVAPPVEAPIETSRTAPASTARKTRARTAAKTAHRRARTKKSTPKSET
jgi:hypothetical protein